MNYRALTLGAIVGFVVAFSPACGQTKCGPQNCDGCCDSKGTCVKKPNNGNNTTCGSAGNACTDCAAAATTCNPTSFTCGSTGAGGGGGGGGMGGGAGGGTPCDGCTLPSGTCVGLARTTVINCGKDAAMCRACATGETCTNGECVVPDAGVASIGSPCTADTDCSTVALTATDRTYGIRPYCKRFGLDATKADGRGPAYTGGYCTKRCGFEETMTTSSCGLPAADCAFSLGLLGDSSNTCFKTCTRDSECRPEYFCLGYASTYGLCMPRTTLEDLPDGGQDVIIVDAGPGFAGEAGGACADNAACQPPADGFCIQESVDAGYVGGACTADCSAVLADSWCGQSGSCVPQGYLSNDNLGPIVLWTCERGCGNQTDGGIAGTCRDGYVCEDQTDPNAVCVPRCTNSGVRCGQGETCDADAGLCR